jgi:hypothetical protein
VVSPLTGGLARSGLPSLLLRSLDELTSYAILAGSSGILEPFGKPRTAYLPPAGGEDQEGTRWARNGHPWAWGTGVKSEGENRGLTLLF